MRGINSWFSPKTAIQASKIAGKGLFATKNIVKDEIIAIKAGHVLEKNAFRKLASKYKRVSLQISDNLFIAPIEDNEISRVNVHINHSCKPNVGLKGHLATVAMRSIKAGEELTGDYCVAYSDDFFEFDCLCGSQNCRKKVTSNDWRVPHLQKKYKGYFAQYLEDKIDTQK